MKPKSNYNKNLKEFSRDLRNDSTLGEIILWKRVLRGKIKFEYQFNRQFPMKINDKSIIVDFICRKLKLIIEIDGYSHQFKTKQDELRDQQLLEMGYQVLRFTESEIKHRLDNVVTVIEAAITQLEN
ncbi:MAG: endonuclease domain-containing protein [Salibacteraceae bacterium]